MWYRVSTSGAQPSRCKAWLSSAITPGTSSASSRGSKSPGDENLPFIPAPKWVSRLEYSGAWGKKLPQNTLFAEVEQVFAQEHPAPYETATSAYTLLHAGLSVSLAGRTPMTLRLVGRNLLDRRYFDHLSRLKNYGIYEPGRDLILSFKINF